MIAAHAVEIVTPKKVVLNGLWLGPKRAKRVIVWVHGLGSSLFSRMSLFPHLLDGQTAVLTFNNRGHDVISRVSTVGPVVSKKTVKGGAAHEVFIDCIDDIEGAIRFARKTGARNIFVAGHSTGCQKSVYWASKKGKGVRGVIILAPISDYAAERAASGISKLRRAAKVARSLVRSGRKHELLPADVWGWPWTADAQRFLSAYSGSGPEEIFTYWDPKRNPRVLRAVKKPLLVLLAQHDEFSDIPADAIGDWFARHIKVGDHVLVVPRVGHGFKGGEKQVAREIKRFITAP